MRVCVCVCVCVCVNVHVRACVRVSAALIDEQDARQICDVDHSQTLSMM